MYCTTVTGTPTLQFHTRSYRPEAAIARTMGAPRCAAAGSGAKALLLEAIAAAVAIVEPAEKPSVTTGLGRPRVSPSVRTQWMQLRTSRIGCGNEPCPADV